jgi:autophagy-related protein 11
LGASYHRAALAHQQSTSRTLESLRCQQSALRIASTVLDLNVLNVADVFDGVAAGAHRELEKQVTLIASVDSDLEMASHVQIHREFMSSAVQRAMDAGSRARTLGDYVSNEKMRQVADTCRGTHGSSRYFLFSNVHMFMSSTGELQDRFQQIEASMKRLSDGATDVRLSLSDTRYVRARIIYSISSTPTRLLDEATAIDQLARELLGKVSDVVSGLDSKHLDTCLVPCHLLIVAQVRSLMSRLCYQVRMIFNSVTHFPTFFVFAELRQLDTSIRKTVSSITDLKVFSSRVHVVPSHVNPRTHSLFTVCVVFDKSVL